MFGKCFTNSNSNFKLRYTFSSFHNLRKLFSLIGLFVGVCYYDSSKMVNLKEIYKYILLIFLKIIVITYKRYIGRNI